MFMYSSILLNEYLNYINITGINIENVSKINTNLNHIYFILNFWLFLSMLFLNKKPPTKVDGFEMNNFILL